jgi:outer membrane protein
MLRYGKPLLGAAILLAALISSAGPSAALEAGDWLLRGRLIGILPTGDGSGIQSDLTTTSLEAENVIVPELDVTYMVTDNIGLELIAATSPHKIDAEGALAGLGTVADIWLLPPTLLAQYHFMPKSDIRPYVGAGVNFTVTYGEHATGSLEGALGPTDVNLGNSLGFAL